MVSQPEIRGLLVGATAYLVGGLLTGPLFGWLGYRWRTSHDWRSALAQHSSASRSPIAAVGTWRVSLPELGHPEVMLTFARPGSKGAGSVGLTRRHEIV